MSAHLSILSSQQRVILSHLAQGRTYRDICASPGFAVRCFHRNLAQIRQKTGILDLRDAACCHAWLASGEVITPGALPSHLQLQVLRFCAIPKSHAWIAREMGLPIEQVKSLARLEKTSRNPDTRLRLIREKLAELEKAADPMNDPAFF